MGITVALSNYERQKRWREKHRALHNLRRRNARKGIKVNPKWKELGPEANVEIIAHPEVMKPYQTKKVGGFNMIVVPKIETEDAPPKPTIFKDDYGRVITEAQWDRLQALKEKAKNGGYEIDQYTQI